MAIDPLSARADEDRLRETPVSSVRTYGSAFRLRQDQCVLAGQMSGSGYGDIRMVLAAHPLGECAIIPEDRKCDTDQRSCLRRGSHARRLHGAGS